MKAVYKKPIAHFEYLALSQTVASNCNATPGGSTLGKPAHWSKATCGWYMDDNTILWVGESTGCTVPFPEDGDVGGICYNNPSNGGIFSS